MPEAAASGEREAAEARLDRHVRPRLRIHGGALDLLEVRDGAAHVRFEGACRGCPLAPVTVKALVEPALVGVGSIDRVVPEGGRVSPQAAARLAAIRPAGDLRRPAS